MKKKLLKLAILFLGIAPMAAANCLTCTNTCDTGSGTQISIECCTDGSCISQVRCGHDYNIVACCEYDRCAVMWCCGYVYCIPGN